MRTPLLFIISLLLIAISKSRAAAIAALVPQIPTGFVQAWAGASDNIPEGWSLCDGRGVRRNQYANLFAVIGTTYGAADGNLNFNLPDLRRRVIAGVDGGSILSDTWAQKPGGKGGNEKHILKETEMP